MPIITNANAREQLRMTVKTIIRDKAARERLRNLVFAHPKTCGCLACSCLRDLEKGITPEVE